MEETKSIIKGVKVEEKKADVKAPAAVTVKAEEKKAEKVVPKKEVKKAETKKTTTARKTATKTTTKKAAAPKKAAKTAAAEKKVNMVLQFGGNEYNTDDILEKIKADIQAETGRKTYKTLDIYVKPEDKIAYYVVNGKPGSVPL